MSNARTLALVALMGLAVALPTVTAESPGITNPNSSSATTLWFHTFSNQDFPINTQQPDDKFNQDASIGLATTSLGCAPPTNQNSVDVLTQKKYTTYYGFSSPGYVEYNYTENGGPRIHPERGLSFDVNLDPAVNPTVYWYISTFTGTKPGSGQPTVDPVIPNVVARATVRTGEKITLGDEGYNSGEIIAQGTTDPETLAGTATASVPNNNMNQLEVTPGDAMTPTIYGFKIPLTYQKTTIPKDSGYSVRIDVYIQPQKGGQCDNPDQGYVMPNMVQTRTDMKHRPRMTLAVMNAVRIEYMHPQFVGDDMVIHTSENSPWGNYDVQEMSGGIDLTITGPNGPVSGVYRAAVVQRYHEHDHHTQAVDVTFVWPYKQVNAGDGKYTINLAVINDQNTAKATGIAQFQIGKDLIVTKCGALGLNAGAESDQKCIDEKQDTNGNAITGPVKKSPAFELIGVIGALGLAAVAMRRKD